MPLHIPRPLPRTGRMEDLVPVLEATLQDLFTLSVGAGVGGTGDLNPQNVHIKGPRPWVDVRHPTYGATGDGVTDDAAAIQAALTAGAGGIVFAPKGTYLVGTRLNVPANTWLVGAGMGVTIFKHRAGLTLQVMQATGAGATFTDFSIDGDQANNTGFVFSELDVNNKDDVLIQRVHIFNFNHIGIAGAATRARILDSRIVGVGLSGPVDTGYGIWSADPAAIGVIIARNTIRNMRTAAIFAGGDGTIIANNFLDNNHLQTTPTGGGHIAWGGAGIKNQTVIGNYIRGGGTATSGIEVHAVDGCLVDGNIIESVGNIGIVLQAGTNLVATNNIIKNSGFGAGPNINVGIYVAANLDGFTLKGNRCYDNQGTKTQVWGIQVAAGSSDNYIIVGNDLRGNVNAAGLSDGGTGTNKTIHSNLPLAPAVGLYGTSFQWATSGNLPTAAGTNYMGPIGSLASTATESVRQVPLGVAIDLIRFYVNITAAPGTGVTRTYTIRKNGVATAATLSFGPTESGGKTWTGSVSFAANDLVSLEEVISGGTAAAASINASLRWRETAA